MAEKTNGKAGRRKRLAKLLVEPVRFRDSFFAEISPLQLLVGVGITLLITSLLVGYQFQRIPDYKVGDIAERTIEAPQNFPVEDHEATLQKRRQAVEKVPGVFDLDARVNNRIESEIRRIFATGREALAAKRQDLNIPASRSLSHKQRDELLTELADRLPDLRNKQVLKIFLEHGFPQELEDELVKMLREAMSYPGVIFSRDALLRYRDRGFRLRNTITGHVDRLEDWMAVKDLARAQDVLRQNEYELTALSGEEKKQTINFLESMVEPNVNHNDLETRALEEKAMNEVDPVLIQIKKGRTIVRAGDEIRPFELLLLNALKKLKQPDRLVGKFAGIFLLVAFFLWTLWRYLLVKKGARRQIRNQYLLAALILVLSLIVTKVFIGLADLVADNLFTRTLDDPIHLYLVAPLALGTILAILLLDLHIAILYSLIFAVFVGLLAGYTPFSIYALTGSLVAIFLLDHYRERSAITKAGLLIGLVNVVTALALQFYSFNTNFEWGLFGIRSLGAFVSGIFAAMLASLFLPILESLFDVTTDIRLLELSNLNKPVLRRLALEAPGTYHHSIMVGTLGEAAAEAMGANPMLVRVGAYYHDIGKLKKPDYYVENQIYCGNKHETLSPNMSSLILASHVKDGLALAEEIGLVSRVKAMIPEHHGTRLMSYFYQKAKDSNDDKHREVSEETFRYPGPKPQSKEAAILMLADQVEAAARTLQEPTPGQIRGLIKRLIQNTIQDGQFDECDITLRDLDVIAQTFERVLTGMYHHRIEYPGYQFNRQFDERRRESQRIQ